MPETRIFNASVFTNYPNLQNFFNQSPAIQEVLNKKNEPYSGVPLPLNPNLDCKWQVCQIATSPFRMVLVVFLKTVAAGLDCCGSSHLAKDMRNWSVRLIIGFEVFSTATTKVSKIAASLNDPNREGEIVNKHPSISENQVPTNVRELTFCQVYHEIKFGHYNGICRGESFWFLYLYLKTKDQFSDRRAHMATLGEQFKDGGGMDPTLLQSINPLGTGQLLNLNIGTQSVADTAYVPVRLIEHTPNEWRSQSAEMTRQLKVMPAGAYAVGFPRHQTAFVKIDDELGFFFDPNRGITEIQGPELAEKLYERVSRTLEETGDNGRASSRVYFTPVMLRA